LCYKLACLDLLCHVFQFFLTLCHRAIFCTHTRLQ
jgi:hypothetical protein